MVVAGAVGLLDGLLHELDDLIVLAELLAEVVGLAELDGGLFDDVHAQSIEDVHEVVHVDLAFGIPIVDGADLLDFISVDRHVWFLVWGFEDSRFQKAQKTDSRVKFVFD